MTYNATAQTVVGAIGGVVAGYVLWLVAISIGNDTTTVSHWSRIVLIGSVILAVCAVVAGCLLRWRRKQFWSVFSFGLPILPVLLTLAVLADVYV